MSGVNDHAYLWVLKTLLDNLIFFGGPAPLSVWPYRGKNGLLMLSARQNWSWSWQNDLDGLRTYASQSRCQNWKRDMWRGVFHTMDPTYSDLRIVHISNSKSKDLNSLILSSFRALAFKKTSQILHYDIHLLVKLFS